MVLCFVCMCRSGKITIVRTVCVCVSFCVRESPSLGNYVNGVVVVDAAIAVAQCYAVDVAGQVLLL